MNSTMDSIRQASGESEKEPARLTALALADAGATVLIHGRDAARVAPGPVHTGGADAGRITGLGKAALLGRAAQPEGIAATIELLASPRAGCVTGAVVAVDGGRAAIRSNVSVSERSPSVAVGSGDARSRILDSAPDRQRRSGRDTTQQRRSNGQCPRQSLPAS